MKQRDLVKQLEKRDLYFTGTAAAMIYTGAEMT